MDKQRELYSRQHATHQNVVDLSPQLLARDTYVVNELQKKKHSSIAELSIGEGRLSRLLLSSFRFASFSFFDISSERLEALKSSVVQVDSSRCVFRDVNFDTEFDSITSDQFNVVIALDILEHVIDVFGFLDNCKRILQPNGTLFLRVPNICFIKHRVNLLMGKVPVTSSWYGKRDNLQGWFENGWDGGHLHLFTIDILGEALARSGFEIESIRDAGARYETFRNTCPSLFFANPLIVAKARN